MVSESGAALGSPCGQGTENNARDVVQSENSIGREKGMSYVHIKNPPPFP